MEGATDTKAWFFKNTLMMLSYTLSGSFKTYYDQLRERYGAPTKVNEGFGGEAFASWKFKDVDLELNHPFMGNFTMSFIYDPLWEQAKKSDAAYYAEVTKQKAKTSKGF
jgi:hypothetical protein